MERGSHASAIINGVSTSPALVVIGGLDNIYQPVNECLLFDNITTGQFSCKKVCVHVHVQYCKFTKILRDSITVYMYIHVNEMYV